MYFIGVTNSAVPSALYCNTFSPSVYSDIFFHLLPLKNSVSQSTQAFEPDNILNSPIARPLIALSNSVMPVLIVSIWDKSIFCISDKFNHFLPNSGVSSFISYLGLLTMFLLVVGVGVYCFC